MEVKKPILALCATIASREGLKSETSMGNVEEIIRILAEEIAKDESLLDLLRDYASTKKN